MAILRSIGAQPLHVFGLLMTEAVLLVVAGTVLGVATVYLVLLAGRPIIENRTGLYLDMSSGGATEIYLLTGIVAGGILAAVVPAIRAYKMSLSDGLVVRT